MISLFSADRQHLLTGSHTAFSLGTHGKRQISGFSFSSSKDTSPVGSRPHFYDLISSIQLLSHVQPFVTSWTAECQASLSFTISWSLLKLMSIESVIPSNYLILCCPFLILSPIIPASDTILLRHFKKQKKNLGKTQYRSPLGQDDGYSFLHQENPSKHTEHPKTPVSLCNSSRTVGQ